MWCRLPQVKWTEIHYSRGMVKKAGVDQQGVDSQLRVSVDLRSVDREVRRVSVDGRASTESSGRRASTTGASIISGGFDPSPVDVGLVVNTGIEQINVGLGIKQITHNMSRPEFKLAFADFTGRSRTTSMTPRTRSTGSKTRSMKRSRILSTSICSSIWRRTSSPRCSTGDS